MAKKEEPENQEEVQEPLKPKKKGELGLVMIIGIIAGTLILLVGLLYAVFWFGVRPYIVPPPPATAETAKDAHGESSKKDKEEGAEGEEGKDGEKPEFNAHDPLAKFFVTGRITTNPRGSASNYVVIDLGIYAYYKDEEAKEKAESGGGHGGSTDKTAMTPELGTLVKGVINRILGSMSVDDLQARRDSLPIVFKKELKPVFKENHFKIFNVVLQEFLIQ